MFQLLWLKTHSHSLACLQSEQAQVRPVEEMPQPQLKTKPRQTEADHGTPTHREEMKQPSSDPSTSTSRSLTVVSTATSTTSRIGAKQPPTHHKRKKKELSPTFLHHSELTLTQFDSELHKVLFRMFSLLDSLRGEIKHKNRWAASLEAFTEILTLCEKKRYLWSEDTLSSSTV